MHRKITKFFIFSLISLMLIIPVISFAQSAPLVPCDNSEANPCDFAQFMILINNIIDFIFKFLALPIAAIMFAYAGFTLVTSGGSPESKTKAKNIFTNVVIGLIIALGAWLIIKTILSLVGYSGAGWIGF